MSPLSAMLVVENNGINFVNFWKQTSHSQCPNIVDKEQCTC
jgi:hypothetical protein